MATKPTADTNCKLRIVVFDVGHGDNILVELPSGEFGLIDFHYESRRGQVEPPSLSYLKNQLSKSLPIVISFVCITHPDSDHIKGIDKFVDWAMEEEIEIKHLWLFAGNDISDFASEVEHYSKKLKKHSSKKHQIEKYKDQLRDVNRLVKYFRGNPKYISGIQRVAKLTEDINIVSLAPQSFEVKHYNQIVRNSFYKLLKCNEKRGSFSRNDISSILMLNFFDHKLIFGGDAGSKTWNKFIDEYSKERHDELYGSTKASFIKASHHGSKSASSIEIWESILDDETFIAISAGNKYDLPNHKTIEDIVKAASRRGFHAKVLSTNICDACVVDEIVKAESILPPPIKPNLLRPDTNMSMKAVRSKRTKLEQGNQFIQRIESYIFEFFQGEREVLVKRSLRIADQLTKSCSYRCNDKECFPNCRLN